MSCAICEKRQPKRYCPAKGEKICAICCGREREITIDCPSDCPHPVAAHRYEAEHRKPLSADDYPYRDIQVREEFVYERWPVITGLAGTILNFQIQHKDLNDGAVCAAIEALAETLRTLGTGIYYEKPPDAPLARALYGQVAEFLQEFRKGDAGRAGIPASKRLRRFPPARISAARCQAGNQRPLPLPRVSRFSRMRASLFQRKPRKTLLESSFPEDRARSLSFDLEFRILDDTERVPERVVDRANQNPIADILYRVLPRSAELDQPLVGALRVFHAPVGDSRRALASPRNPASGTRPNSYPPTLKPT